MRHIGQTAAVDDRCLFLFFLEACKFGVVRCCYNQRVERPFKSFDFDGAVLNHAQIDLHEVAFVFENLVGQVNAAAGHAGQCATSQVEAVRVVGIGQMQQSADAFITQQVNRTGSDFILGRIFSRQSSARFAHRHRNNINMFEHFGHIAAEIFLHLVKYKIGTCTQRPVGFKKFIQLSISVTKL
ncbi:hypothetical protein DSECCO2_605820 [anaerobic digester metagenome]